MIDKGKLLHAEAYFARAAFIRHPKTATVGILWHVDANARFFLTPAMASRANSIPRDRSRLAQEREFHKYYLFGPTGPDLGERTSTADHGRIAVAQHSHDTSLTAFAQLGALRLNARRAVISLFDRSHQHILAEATRTLSLQTGQPDHDDDRLWFGVRSLPREYGICSHIVDIPRVRVKGRSDTTSLEQIRKMALVVPDVREDPRFQGTGLVADFPNARFYAGVPIVSPKGIVIGSYSIIDDTTRDTLDPALQAFMAAMSKTVMNHLSLARVSEASRRGDRMIDGLGSFIEGKATLRGPTRKAHLADTQAHVEADTVEGHLDSKQQSLLLQTRSDRRRDTMSGDFPKPPGISRPVERLLETKSTEKVDTVTDRPADAKDPPGQPPDTAPPSKVREAFARAANIIRESMQVQGAVFFDASLPSYGCKPEDIQTESSETDGTSRCSDDCSDSSVPESASVTATGDDVDPDSIAACEVLGFSTSLTSSINHDLTATDKFVMHGKLLRALLRRYPRGKIFNFDEEGSISSGDTSEGSSRQLSKLVELQADSDPRPRLVRKKSTRESRRRAEASDIIHIFPGARSVCFLPLWDSHRSRWFAGIVAWTCIPQRVFTVAPDLLFLHAFGNNLMAEIHRLDIESTHNQHATLISSISHELRSPLHGILGSSELLRDIPLNTTQRDMIQTMESCGQTLLDIINHLLDFAKINQSNIHRSAKSSTSLQQRTSKTRKHPKTMDSKKPLGLIRPTGLTPEIDLATITEEVVDAVYAGHCFQRMSKFQFHTLDTVLSAKSRFTSKHIANTGKGNNVAIVLDIDQSVNWKLKMEPGAWRRILMNIFGNALKHTETGFVHVRLSFLRASSSKSGDPEEPSTEKHGSKDASSQILLTIQDTGRGISQEYLKNHLYTPFSQENPLLPGNGLGLSIVQHTVQSLGGSIDIQSTGSSGCDVSVRVKAPPMPLHIDLPSSPFAQTRSKSLGFIGFNSSIESAWDATSLVENSLRTLCEKFLGIQFKVLDFSQDIFQACDYFFLAQLGSTTLQELATQTCVVNEKRKQHRCLDSPLIVLCTTPCDAQELLAIARGIDEEVAIEVISQPCGPRKFAKTLELCTEHNVPPRRLDSSSSDQLPSEPISTPDPDSMIEMNLGPEDKDQSYMELTPKPKSNEYDPVDLEMDTLGISERKEHLDNAEAKLSAENTANISDSPKALIVDDNEINQKLLAAFLKKQKWSYTTAANGLEALKAFHAEPGAFKVIFMDITMPVMDGLTATREVRHLEQSYLSSLDAAAKASWKPVTIVAVTGLGSVTAQQEAFNSGVDDFLMRPVRFGDLRGILEADR
ncbi:hypothetical protein N7492_007421 [Penicillium capsulatum]|uniref:Uncharacterized protein n=1 Tax=Penicillium capsulatum TaxID=69766 RepID=A0A9W9HZS8_9EURO|nr:hypothetical protein N7492_007421 [Penicillium capsulatum]KAJ6117257.1 hypothetical protein N7512_006982 [Penicillium capsulatum]